MTKILNKIESQYERALEKLSSMDFDANLESFSDVNKVKEFLKNLRIHEIELEMQNWELLKASNEIEEKRDYYLDYYENSPIGHVKIDKKGMILAVNTKLAVMLKLEKVDLLKANFYSILKDTTQADKLHVAIYKLVETKDNQVFDLILNMGSPNESKHLTTASIKRNQESDKQEINLCLMSY